MTSKTGIINDLRMLNHKSKRKHPENPARVKAIMKMLEDKHYLSHPRVDYIDNYDRLATNEEIGLAYPQKYIKYV
jgi:acetoin utilization deacetylase AcuC-like enzyme